MRMPEREGQKRLCVATNIFNIDPVPYSSHLAMWYRMGKDLPGWDIVFAGPWRMPIDVARNRAVSIALQENCDYLFFYDDDMVMTPTVVQQLLDRVSKQEIHIISALVFIRGYPFAPMVFRFRDETCMGLFDYKESDIEENGLVSVDAVGCAATLIDCNLLKLMSDPWFLTGKLHTEDVYFCMKAKEFVEGVKIYMDTKVECGHMLDKPILTSVSKNALLELHGKGLDQLWQPNLVERKDVVKGFVEEEFIAKDFDVTPKD